MSGMFDRDGRTTARHILIAAKFFRDNPDAFIHSGLWYEPTWTRADFARWFTACLHAKIDRQDPRNGWRKMGWQYQSDLANDARQVNDYLGKHVRHTGCSGILRTKEMRQKYPQVNIQRED